MTHLSNYEIKILVTYLNRDLPLLHFSPKKRIITDKSLIIPELKCTFYKQLRFSFFPYPIIHTDIYVFLRIIFLLSQITVVIFLDWGLKLQQFYHLPEWPQIPNWLWWRSYYRASSISNKFCLSEHNCLIFRYFWNKNELTSKVHGTLDT